MKKLFLLFVIIAFGLTAAGQVAPLGIYVEPPAPEGLTVRVWMDKPVYAVGESVQATFQINKAAYIYIWDIEPTGTVRQIFPNQYDSNNYFQAGVHRIPTAGTAYRLAVTPPTGTEWLQIMAVTRPATSVFGSGSALFPFPVLGQNPTAWSAHLRVQVQGIAPSQADRAFDFTKFEIISGTAPTYGTLQINSTPASAELYVDSVFRSWTPRSIVLTAGYHDIAIRKAGYQEHTTRVYVRSNSTQTLTVALVPVTTNLAPVSRFSVMPSIPRVGETIQLDASASTDTDGAISSYKWDFNGDGITDQTGKTATWQYLISGTATVRLTVTDNLGASGQSSQTLTIRAANQVPVALFYASPTSPTVWSPVTLDAGSSYDPDGTIATYRWDLDGDGIVDQTGQTITKTYYTPATYWVTLYVTDMAGSTGIRSLPLTVSPSGIPGMPAMGNVPGIYVWGTDTWRITVNGSPLWTTPRPYRIELRTDGIFFSSAPGSGVSPMGLVPTATSEGWKLILEGSVGVTAQTYVIQAAAATSIYMDLALDTDGDGYVNRSTGFVRFGQSMVTAPCNPIVIGKPDGYYGTLTPNLNYKLGTPVLYSEASRLVFYFTTIGALAGTP